MKDVRAFHNKPELKEECLARLRWHHDQDQIIQGEYGEWNPERPDVFRGCDMGCLTHARARQDTHVLAEELWGFPEKFNWLLDHLFESLPTEEAREFPIQHVEATPVGADLSLIVPKMILWSLSDPEYGALQFCNEKEVRGVKVGYKVVIDLYQRVCNGEHIPYFEWKSAGDSTYWAAYYAVEAWSTPSITRMYTCACLLYRDDGDDDRFERGVRFYQAFRDQLLQLLREAE